MFVRFPKKARSKWRECISQLILYFLAQKILSCKIGKYMWLAFNLLHAKMNNIKIFTIHRLEYFEAKSDKNYSDYLFCNKYVIYFLCVVEIEQYIKVLVSTIGSYVNRWQEISFSPFLICHTQNWWKLDRKNIIIWKQAITCLERKKMQCKYVE